MNVLWLTHPESDYAASMLVDAFTSADSGVKCIDFYPHKWQYFGEVHRYELPAIANGTTGPAQWMEPLTSKHVDLGGANASLDGQGHYGLTDGAWLDLVCERLRTNHYDLVVLESQRMCVLKTLAETNVAHYVAQLKIPTLVCDGEDSWETNMKTGNMRVDLLLKREYLRKMGPSDRVMLGGTGTLIVAYPFCTTRLMVTEAMKTPWQPDATDASLLVGNTFDVRRCVATALRDAKDLNVPVHTNIENVNGQSLLDWPDYIARARKSRCTIVPRGWGLDTLRFWELLPATILCAQRTELVLPFTFTNRHDILWWDTPEECVEQIRWLKRQSAQTVHGIFMAQHNRLMKYHTSSARMRWIRELVADVTAAKDLRRPTP